MGQRRAAVPLERADLYERLQALQRRNRGARQRAKNLWARQDSSGRGDGRSAASVAAQRPVAEVPANLTLNDVA